MTVAAPHSHVAWIAVTSGRVVGPEDRDVCAGGRRHVPAARRPSRRASSCSSRHGTRDTGPSSPAAEPRKVIGTGSVGRRLETRCERRQRAYASDPASAVRRYAFAPTQWRCRGRSASGEWPHRRRRASRSRTAHRRRAARSSRCGPPVPARGPRRRRRRAGPGRRRRRRRPRNRRRPDELDAGDRGRDPGPVHQVGNERTDPHDAEG